MRTLEFEIPDDFAERLAATEDGDLSRAAQVGLNKIVTAFLTPADELRPIDRATDSQKTAYNRLSATAKAARRERDTSIIQMATEGITRASIAETVGLSTIRVNQIVADYKAKNKGLDTEV